MESFAFEIPDAISAKLQPYKDKLQELLLLGLQQLKIQEALLLYTRDLVSFERAAEITGSPEKRK